MTSQAGYVGPNPIQTAFTHAVESGAKAVVSEAVQQKICSTGEIVSQMMNRTIEGIKPVTEFARKLWDKIPIPESLSGVSSTTTTILKWIIAPFILIAAAKIGVGLMFMSFLVGAIGGKIYESLSDAKEVEENKKKMIGGSYAAHYATAGSLAAVTVPVLFVAMLFWGSGEKEKEMQPKPQPA